MSVSTGTDWTRILSDPDMVKQVGKLLQAYREAPAHRREEALLQAMQEIKGGAASPVKSKKTERLEPSSGEQNPAPARSPSSAARPVPAPVESAPPFEPDLFGPNWGSDRRRHPRIKCFVAVELRVDGTPMPIWGNLSNTSVGGCLVETATPLQAGAKVEIGLWVPNGKIWVKGFALNGTITSSGPTAGTRVRFDGITPVERDNLRQFLKFVQDTTRAVHNENSYLNLLK